MAFEDLESWQNARRLTKQVYSVTREDGIARDFGLCSQIQRATVSAMSNLAEGFERHHIPEGLQFYSVAHASTAEVRSLTYVIEDNYPALAAQATSLRNQSVKSVTTGRLVGGLIRSTESRKTKLSSLLTAIFTFLAPITTCSIPAVLVKICVGGVSNASLRNRLLAHQYDRKAWTVNGLRPYPWTLLLKPVRKLGQWLA